MPPRLTRAQRRAQDWCQKDNPLFPVPRDTGPKASTYKMAPVLGNFGHTQDSQDSEDSQDSKDSQDSEESDDGSEDSVQVVGDPIQAVCDVFGTPELFVAIMRDLTTRDLTRTLSVSKQWNGAIASSTELRRKLFLLPSREEKSYFQCNYPDPDTIVSQPSDSSKLIVEPHPIIAPYRRRGWSECVAIDWMKCYKLTMVPPATFLCQPPVEKVLIVHRRREVWIQREEGPTFGAVVENLEAMDEDYKHQNPRIREAMSDEDKGILANDPNYGYSTLLLVGHRCSYLTIDAMGVVSTASKEVEAARTTQAHAQFLAALK